MSTERQIFAEKMNAAGLVPDKAGNWGVGMGRLVSHTPLRKLFIVWYNFNYRNAEGSLPSKNDELKYLTDEWIRRYIEWQLSDDDVEISEGHVAAYKKALSSDVNASSNYLQFCRDCLDDANEKLNITDDPTSDIDAMQRFINEFLQLEGELTPQMLGLLFSREYSFKSNFINEDGKYFKVGHNLMRCIKLSVKRAGLLYEGFKFDGAVREGAINGSEPLLAGNSKGFDTDHTDKRIFVIDIPLTSVPSSGSGLGDWLWKARVSRICLHHRLTALVLPICMRLGK